MQSLRQARTLRLGGAAHRHRPALYRAWHRESFSSAFRAMPGADQAGGSLPPLICLPRYWRVFGGLAILAGLFTRPVAFILSGMMAVAYWMAHVPKGGFFPLSNGGDAAVLFCFIFLYLVFAGAGAWSVDGMRSPARISS